MMYIVPVLLLVTLVGSQSYRCPQDSNISDAEVRYWLDEMEVSLAKVNKPLPPLCFIEFADHLARMGQDHTAFRLCNDGGTS